MYFLYFSTTLFLAFLCCHFLLHLYEHVCRYIFAEDGSLRIHSAQVPDTGRYLCMATNQAGTQHKRVDLQVDGEW